VLIAAALLLQPYTLLASEPEFPTEPEAMVDQITDCMLALDGASHFFEDAGHRSQGRFDEQELAKLKTSWVHYNMARPDAYYAAQWDEEQRQSHFQAQRRDFWRRYFDRESGEYRPSRQQLLDLAQQARACQADPTGVGLHAARLRDYQQFTTCSAVAGPLAERMAVDPEFGAALGVTAEQVDALANQAFTVLEQVSNRLGHGNDETRQRLQSRMEAFWNAPDPDDGTTLGDCVAFVLGTCDQQLFQRRATEWASDVEIPEGLTPRDQ
jgi:hypothetical protein